MSEHGDFLKKEHYLFKFRRCSSLVTLERMKHQLEQQLCPESSEFQELQSASLHRKAEIAVGRFLDSGHVSEALKAYAAAKPSIDPTQPAWS